MIFPTSLNASVLIVVAIVKSMNETTACCRVDAVVTIDSKGQIVLPKDLREEVGLRPDDKLAVIACEKEGKMCCIMMVKADELGKTVKVMLGPTLKEIFK
jgi:AbrB family looped-hinge helix DNA binding protein